VSIARLGKTCVVVVVVVAVLDRELAVLASCDAYNKAYCRS
jgi:hypothetical protein